MPRSKHVFRNKKEPRLLHERLDKPSCLGSGKHKIECGSVRWQVVGRTTQEDQTQLNTLIRRCRKKEHLKLELSKETGPNRQKKAYFWRYCLSTENTICNAVNVQALSISQGQRLEFELAGLMLVGQPASSRSTLQLRTRCPRCNRRLALAKGQRGSRS